MPVTMQQVRAQLDRDEPDYPTAAQLGPTAVVQLAKLVRGTDALLAAKAAYLASLIPGDQSRVVLDDAARSQQGQVRVAAAAGIRNLPDAPLDLIDTLLKDSDAGVRKVALRSIDTRQFTGLKARVEAIAKSDAEDFVRKIADQTAKRLS